MRSFEQEYRIIDSMKWRINRLSNFLKLLEFDAFDKSVEKLILLLLDFTVVIMTVML